MISKIIDKYLLCISGFVQFEFFYKIPLAFKTGFLKLHLFWDFRTPCLQVVGKECVGRS